MARALYNGTEDMIEIIIRDGRGAKIDSRIFCMSDEREKKKVLFWLKNKYDIDFSFPIPVESKASFLDF